MKNSKSEQAKKGANPFNYFKISDVSMGNIVKSYDPPYNDSSAVYNHIKTNLPSWIEEAIKIRENN